PFMRSRFLASASLCARYSARAFVLVVGLGVAGEGVRVTHRTRHLGERRMLRSPRLATEHIPDGRGRQPGEHGEIVLLDAVLLPKCSEVIDLGVFIDKIVRAGQPFLSHGSPPRAKEPR